MTILLPFGAGHLLVSLLTPKTNQNLMMLRNTLSVRSKPTCVCVVCVSLVYFSSS